MTKFRAAVATLFLLIAACFGAGNARGAFWTVDIVENDPPRKLVSKVKETEKMFGGTWTVAVAPLENGSTVTITEDGWVANPIFRFVSRFVMGHHATMDGMLKSVAKNFGEEPVLSGE